MNTLTIDTLTIDTLTMDTLTGIRAFIDVVEAEGFSTAARRNGPSKALLSKYVRELEDKLGALLLNRTTRQFSMTEAGYTYHTASDILNQIDNLVGLVRENNAQLKGQLRVSVPRTFVDAEVGQSLIDFATDNLGLVLEIAADDRFVYLIEKCFDVAMRVPKLEDSGMIACKVSEFRLHIYATPDFLERYADLAHSSDLANVPFLIDTNARNPSSTRLYNPDSTHSPFRCLER